jgi:hypothetical protein
LKIENAALIISDSRENVKATLFIP